MDLARFIDTMIGAITALSIALPILWKVWSDIRKVRGTQDAQWQGLVARGFLEAIECDLLTREKGPAGEVRWLSTEKARAAYREIMADLRQLGVEMAMKGGHVSDAAVAWEVEQKYQAWLIDNVCARLGVNRYGCVAVAAILARES